MLLPMPAHQHGKDMITVKVGKDELCQEFSIHKNLICAISPYFKGALNPGFKTSVDKTVKLEEECPMAFAVLYHFLYTSKVSDETTFYTEGKIPKDLHWLRTLKLADFTLVHPLLLIAYERVRQLFSSTGNRVPSIAFIDELYDEVPLVNLQQYIVGHTVFWIRGLSDQDWKEWKAVLDRRPQFGVAVAVQFAKYHSDLYLGHKKHPIKDHALYADEMFPEPKQEVKTEMAVEQQPGKDGNGGEQK